MCQATHDPALKAPLTERIPALLGRVEVLQVSRPAVRADNRPGPGGTQRPILRLPCAQQDGLLVERQLQLRTALDVRSPVLLGVHLLGDYSNALSLDVAPSSTTHGEVLGKRYSTKSSSTISLARV